MKLLLPIFLLFTVSFCIRVSQNSAYNVLQNEIASLNNEKSANEKSIREMRGTMKQMMNELRNLKAASVQRPATPAAASSNTTRLTPADRAKLANINKISAEIKDMKNKLKAPLPKLVVADLGQAGDAAAAAKTNAADKPKNDNASKEINELEKIDKKLNALQSSMDSKKVQREEEKTDSELKAELKQLDSKLSLIDKFAVQKINRHARRPRGPKTVEEKNLNRRKRYIAMREKAVLDELNKAEMNLFSVTPTFQGTMKDSLRMIFKNEDKQRVQQAPAKNASLDVMAAAAESVNDLESLAPK